MPTSLSQDELAAVLGKIIDGAIEAHGHEKLHAHAAKGEFLELPVTIRLKFRKPGPNQQGVSRDDICCICYGPGPGQFGPPYCRGSCC